MSAVQAGHGGVGGFLHPLLQRVGAVLLVARLLVQALEGFLHADALAVQLAGHFALLSVDGGQALAAPLVGFV